MIINFLGYAELGNTFQKITKI